MIDIRLIRSQPEEVRAQLALRDPNASAELTRFIEFDTEHRGALTQLEQIKSQINSSSKAIGQLRAKSQLEEAKEAQSQVTALKTRENELQEIEAALRKTIDDWLYKTPNLLHPSTPLGGEENNQVVRTVGELPRFNFEPKPHWEIAERLGLVDFARGAKLAGSGFVLYRGKGAQLERGLIRFMLDLHIDTHGFTEWALPFFLNRQSITASAHIVKFTPEMYHDDESDLFALPTAEPALINIHRDEILDGRQLPLNYVAHTPCWRREAGAAGKDTRGLQRLHQFDKVEMVKFTTPESSYDALEDMISDAADVLSQLGLAYRVVNIAAQDVGFSAAKQVDLEIYAPGTGKWLEISSCSNCEDFQARRGNIRFRREPAAKPEFVHILNGSGTALSRLYATLLETYQREDGSIVLPEVLKPYMGGQAVLE